MIQPTYVDALGRDHEVPPGTIKELREAIGSTTAETPIVSRTGETQPVDAPQVILEDGRLIDLDGALPPDLPPGYHRLVGAGTERRLIVSPGVCHIPEDGQRWGWSSQLYATRSTTSWGMGDLGDLRRLAEGANASGASMVLVSPLLAGSPTTPRQPSPYFPATRRFRDPIYLRVEEVPGSEQAGDTVAEAARTGHALNRSGLIDRDAVWRLKLTALEAIWSAIEPGAAFEEWRAGQGDALEQFGTWCVLAENLGGDWRRWPAEYTRPEASGIAGLREHQRDRVRFHQWLQWLCHVQLERVATGTMLVQDLPIGFDPGGFDAWSWQDLIAPGVSIGAPPDEFNTRGQNWGLPPFIPHRLRAAGYEPFIQTIRAGLIHGGGLRIDHVLGLFRQFWIPAGRTPSEGAYVTFPADDLLAIIALESYRAQATVVGEDLGTVGPGVREALARHRLLSYRLLWFEQTEPCTWPELSMASVTTHDLPTVVGLWTGADLAEQEELDMHPNRESTQRLRSAVAEWTSLEDGADRPDVVTEVHRQLAGAPSLLLCPTLEDAAMTDRRPNMPGADARRPNWSVALDRSLEDLLADPLTARLASMFNRAVGSTPEEPDDATA